MSYGLVALWPYLYIYIARCLGAKTCTGGSQDSVQSCLLELNQTLTLTDLQFVVTNLIHLVSS